MTTTLTRRMRRAGGEDRPVQRSAARGSEGIADIELDDDDALILLR